MGRMSGAHPSLFLFSAIKDPPDRNLDTKVGAFPAARILMTNLRDVHIGVGRGMLATSSRCWTHKPEGPAAVSFGNERRTERMLKSGCSTITSVSRTAGTTGAGQLGCLLSKVAMCSHCWEQYHLTAGTDKLSQTCQICPER